MDQTAWRVFLEAADLGSLSKVALARNTSQPHISRRISELEQACGGRLFQRNGRGVTLTEFGRRIANGMRAFGGDAPGGFGRSQCGGDLALQS